VIARGKLYLRHKDRLLCYELTASAKPAGPTAARCGDADIWLVMLVGQGAPPVATIAGTGLDSVLTVAGRKVRFDAKANRVKTE
jgi:hypothetical protein